MREIDKDGLLLCNLQGEIFSSSLEYTSSSSEIFMRRFMSSDLSKEFDRLAVLNDSLTIKDAFDELNNEFGETSYGKVKYNKEVLFWIGYLYRYMAYTYELSSKQIYKIIKPKELKELYYVYHTFDCAQAIERILEGKNISYDYKKQNEELLKLMRTKKYEREVSVILLNTGFAHQVSDNFNEYTSSEEKYSESKTKEEHFALAVLYKNEAVGKICLQKCNEEQYELSIELISDKYKNKGLGSVAISKAIEYAKEEMKIKSIIVEILKTDERSIHVFKKMNFSYTSENDRFVYFSKQL